MEDYDDSDYLTDEELLEWSNYDDNRRLNDCELFDDDYDDYGSDYEYQRSLMTRTERLKCDFWFWWWNTRIGNKVFWWNWNRKNKDSEEIPF